MRCARSVFAILLMFGAPAVAAAQAPASETVKAELRAFVSELSAALQARDRDAIERLYAPDFVFVHALGPPIDRATHIATSMAGKPRPGGLPIPSFDGLVTSGDLAILRTREDLRYSTTIYTKSSGRWQVLHIQGTPIPSSKPAVSVPVDVLRSYAGRYQQDNALVVTISVESDALMLQVDGRQKFQLVPVSASQFNIPGGGGQITFATAADGRVTYEVQRVNQNVVKGTKQP
jgi:ketosteroid isomerase-like protein